MTVAFRNLSFGVYKINIFEDQSVISCLLTFKQDSSMGRVLSLKMHRTKPIIAFGDSKESLVVWDWKAKAYLLKQQAVAEMPTASAFSADGKFFAVGDAVGQVKVFDFKSRFNVSTFQDAHSKITHLRYFFNY